MLFIGLSLVLLNGCATTMEQAFRPELRYGQLYALEDALNAANSDCSDQEASFSATYWASTALDALTDHNQYLETDSPQQSKSRELIAQLYSLQYDAANVASHCQQIAVAGITTRELLALLN